jgi:hypothetical protein
LQLYLLALDTINMQQPLQATSQVIQKLSGSSSSPSMKTVKKYISNSELNKTLNQTSIHVTLVLCSSPGQMGSMMTPHFLYQCPEGAD